MPGVSEAGFTSDLPFSGVLTAQGSTVIEGYVPAAGDSPPHAQLRRIDEGYLPALGIPVVAGRNFAASETERVAIVDENLAAKYWPGGSALGQRLRDSLDPPDRWFTIIGVVPAVKQESLAEAPVKETVYWHYKQRPSLTGVLALRTTLPPEQLTRAATATLAALDPDLALFDVMPMDMRVLRSLGPQRTSMALTLIFAVVAFTLAVIGVYGVLNWAVTQRVGEIGVRMALGARAADIAAMFVKQGSLMIAVGIGIGIAGAVGLGRVLSSQLHDVSASDPMVFAIAVGGLTAAAILASWLPARRASQIDPMQALREE